MYYIIIYYLHVSTTNAGYRRVHSTKSRGVPCRPSSLTAVIPWIVPGKMLGTPWRWSPWELPRRQKSAWAAQGDAMDGLPSGNLT